MKENQTFAATQGRVESDLRGKDERRADSRIHEALRVRQRLVAWSCLAGIGAGAAITYYLGERLARGVTWGGIAGMAIGKVVDWWQHRADAI